MWSLPIAFTFLLAVFTLSNLPSNSILLSYTILIMATNSQFEKFGQHFGFVVSSTGALLCLLMNEIL